jgi:hypothetical protein
VSCLSEIVKRGVAMPDKPGRCSREGSRLFSQSLGDRRASPWSVIMSWADDGDELLLVPTSHQGRYLLICALHSVKAERCPEFVIGQKEKCSNVYNLINLIVRLPNSFK